MRPLLLICLALLCCPAFGQWYERKVIPFNGTTHSLLADPDTPRDCTVIGDVNADGVPDVAVSLRHSPSNTVERIILISGKDGAVVRIIDDPDHGSGSDPGFTWFGVPLLGLPDVTGDGKGDLLAVSLLADLSGKVWFVSGGDGALTPLTNPFAPPSLNSDGYRVADLGDLWGNNGHVVAVSSPFISVNLFNLPGGGLSHHVGGVFLYQVSSPLQTSSFGITGTAEFQEFGSSLSAVGDVNGDGVQELGIGGGGQAPIMVNGVPADFVIYDVLAGMPIRGHAANGHAVGLGDVNGDGCDDYALSSEGRAVSGLDGTTLYTFPAHFELESCGDLDGDGINELCSRGSFRSGADGSLLFQTFNYMTLSDGPDLRAVHGPAGDFDGDGFNELFIVRGSLTNWEIVFLSMHGARRFGSSSGQASSLDLSWAAGGQTDPAVGSIQVSGATPGGHGRMGVSLTPAGFDFLGLQVLVDPNPGNLIGFADFGYDQFGTFAAPAFIRSPWVAGVSFYFQAFQTWPTIEASNGLELRFTP